MGVQLVHADLPVGKSHMRGLVEKIRINWNMDRQGYLRELEREY